MFKNRTKLKTKRIFLLFLLLKTKLVFKSCNQTLVLTFLKLVFQINLLHSYIIYSKKEDEFIASIFNWLLIIQHVLKTLNK